MITVGAPTAARVRLQSIDILRGLVMVVMAIDHIRDFLHAGAQHFSPEDLTRTTVILFLTRWITHFCAPVFVFLAGTSAWLYGRGRRHSDVVRFLLTRGLWLIVVEITIVLLAATFNLSYAYVILQVIWAIGCSMIALAVLSTLPWRVLLAVSVVMIAGHNLLDGIRPERFGTFAWLWQILHAGPAFIPLSGAHTIIEIYPLVPWIGVMSAGYCFGRVLEQDAGNRRRLLWRLGGAITGGWLAVRLINGYGDPVAWSRQPRAAMTVLSFLSASKYPPSLVYLLMTLGPALLMLALLDGTRVGRRHPLLVFGRVPFFYYVLHWYTLHMVALVMAWVRYGRYDFMFGLPPALLPVSTSYPADYGYSLAAVYIVWAAIVTGLYPICVWYAGVKERHRSAWLSYL